MVRKYIKNRMIVQSGTRGEGQAGEKRKRGVNQVHTASRHPLGMPIDKKEKKPAAPYSRTDEFRTTLGEGALDFRVRNGYGYDSPSMATGKKAGAWTPREPHRTGKRKIRFL